MDTNINSTKRTDIYSVDPRNVVVVDNFNVRRDFAIDELKEQIKLQGVLRGCRHQAYQGNFPASQYQRRRFAHRADDEE